MPKINLDAAPVFSGSIYPAPYDQVCKGRHKQALGDLGGLTQFGVNKTLLKPGAASADRHWHKNEDEFILVLAGEVVLVEDDGETVLREGEAATFKAGVPNGHMIKNNSTADAVILEVGTRSPDEVSTYTDPDVDMRLEKSDGGRWQVLHKDGTPY